MIKIRTERHWLHGKPLAWDVTVQYIYITSSIQATANPLALDVTVQYIYTISNIQDTANPLAWDVTVQYINTTSNIQDTINPLAPENTPSTGEYTITCGCWFHGGYILYFFTLLSRGM